MQLWLFFTIFGLVLFIPSSLLFILLNRFKNTIVVLIKQNGMLVKVVITNKTLEEGQITKINNKNINIRSKNEINACYRFHAIFIGSNLCYNWRFWLRHLAGVNPMAFNSFGFNPLWNLF